MWCGRRRHLYHAGKAKCQVTTASVWLLMLDKEE